MLFSQAPPVKQERNQADETGNHYHHHDRLLPEYKECHDQGSGQVPWCDDHRNDSPGCGWLPVGQYLWISDYPLKPLEKPPWNVIPQVPVDSHIQ